MPCGSSSCGLPGSTGACAPGSQLCVQALSLAFKVHLADSKALRHKQLAMDDGKGRNRTTQAMVLREEPLVLAIQGLATQEECEELIKSQDSRLKAKFHLILHLLAY